MNAIESALKTVLSSVSESLAKDIRKELSGNEAFSEYFRQASGAEIITDVLGGVKYSQEIRVRTH